MPNPPLQNCLKCWYKAYWVKLLLHVTTFIGMTSLLHDFHIKTIVCRYDAMKQLKRMYAQLATPHWGFSGPM